MLFGYRGSSRAGRFCRSPEYTAGRVFTCAAYFGKISHDADGDFLASRFRPH